MNFLKLAQPVGLLHNWNHGKSAHLCCFCVSLGPGSLDLLYWKQKYTEVYLLLLQRVSAEKASIS